MLAFALERVRALLDDELLARDGLYSGLWRAQQESAAPAAVERL